LLPNNQLHEETTMRVMVAMSGGVDSSVAAGLMVEAGHDVVGLTMKLRDATPAEMERRGGSCCSPDDLMDAREVCDALGVPHYIVDYRDVFRRTVIEPFAADYLAGRTPNPCVQCNDHVKFAPLLERAKALGADLLITGHYAQVLPHGDGWALHRALDLNKDQSYFLFGVPGDALAMTRFPLGELDKMTVRAKAKAMGLPNWDKADSEDICFVPDGNYARVVEKIVGAKNVPSAGPIMHQDGRELGVHRGVHNYTVGQRKGLGVAAGERLYVLSLDGPSKTIVVGGPEALISHGLRANRLRWIAGEPPSASFAATARIRHRHRGIAVQVEVDGAHMRVRFEEPESAIAPGQAVVLYDGSRVLGGGWITQAEHAEAA
jgi:tRNA-specific 2-thiouridylase